MWYGEYKRRLKDTYRVTEGMREVVENKEAEDFLEKRARGLKWVVDEVHRLGEMSPRERTAKELKAIEAGLDAIQADLVSRPDYLEGKSGVQWIVDKLTVLIREAREQRDVRMLTNAVGEDVATYLEELRGEIPEIEGDDKGDVRDFLRAIYWSAKQEKRAKENEGGEDELNWRVAVIGWKFAAMAVLEEWKKQGITVPDEEEWRAKVEGMLLFGMTENGTIPLRMVKPAVGGAETKYGTHAEEIERIEGWLDKAEDEDDYEDENDFEDEECEECEE